MACCNAPRDRLPPAGQNGVRFESEQFPNLPARLFDLATSGAPLNVDPQVAAFDPTQPLEFLPECFEAQSKFLVVLVAAEADADAPLPLALL